MFKVQTNHKTAGSLFCHASMPTPLVILAAGIFVLFIAAWGQAARLSADSASAAADSFLVERFPAHDPAQARTRTAKGNSPFHVQQVTRLQDNNADLFGYLVRLEPQGFLLFSTDDQAPPVKLYSEHGSYENLPPAFRAVIEKEMLEDQAALAAVTPMSRAHLARYTNQWQSLLDAQAQAYDVGGVALDANGVSILTTTWNQDSPYNYYCPAASGGPGGRAYAGCTATALGQMLRHHRQPLAVVGSHFYYDGSGSCTGTHAFTDAGTGAYDWANMPASITIGSPTAQIQAIGQLIYHCAVSLDTNFEASGSSAAAQDVPTALRSHFGYTCADYRWKYDYTSFDWYNLIVADINLNHPVLYAMWEGGYTNGHVVVCDGYRGGNEMHLNMGWGGAYDAWYNIDSVSAYGYTWTTHGGVFSIIANNYTLDLTKTGSGSVKVNSVLRTLPWSGTFAVGSTVTLEGIPDSGYIMAGWSGDLSGSTNPTSIVMNGYKSVTAIFSPPYGSLCVTIGPPGSVTSGASWRRVGTSTWIPGGQTEAVVAVGSYTVEFKDVLGWTKPVSFDVSVSEGSLTTASATYTMNHEITIGTGTSTWGWLLMTQYEDSRTQSIYLAGEIGGPRTITGLAIDVTTIPGLPMNNFTIRMKHTALGSYNVSPAWEGAGWTTVYQANKTISTTGWANSVFTMPFNFNYSDGNNVMVDISFNNSTWSNNWGYCRTTSSPSLLRVVYNAMDGVDGYGDPLTWTGTTPPVFYEFRYPNIKLTVVAHGDANRDFNVNFADFAIVAAKWQQSSCNAGNQWCAWADIDRSGAVNYRDIFELANHWLE